MRELRRGFTLIELLIVVAIIGIIASILIPNLLDALQKAKQRRTVAEMRNLGVAWMSWLTDQVGAAAAGAVAPTYQGKRLKRITHAQLDGYLRPSPDFAYTNSVTKVDGWQNPLSYCLNDVLTESNVMMICSMGRNGAFGDNPDGNTGCCEVNWTVGAFVTTDYDQDIVWADGYMVRYPGATR